jgi:hypothetical protein
MSTSASDYGPQLLLHHAALLRASGIAADVATVRGYRSVDTAAALGRLGFSQSQRRPPALLIPIWGVTDEFATYQIRPDTPLVVDGKVLKYETPAKSRLALDVPPAARPGLADIRVERIPAGIRAELPRCSGACL